jgi:hypothetical protein
MRQGHGLKQRNQLNINDAPIAPQGVALAMSA